MQDLTLADLKNDLTALANAEKAKVLLRFFKTGPGQYAEGDTFLGIIVPEQRKIAKKHIRLHMKDIGQLLQSPVHEHRLTALMIMTYRYPKAPAQEQTELYALYLNHTKYINNWDLVDSSAEYIVGAYLEDKDRSILLQLAASESLWERRIAMLACFHFIKKKSFDDAFRVMELLLEQGERQDLMHKAMGWMLREIGNRSFEAEEAFLGQYYKEMPRTMLRYAIEKFPEDKRQRYLKGSI